MIATQREEAREAIGNEDAWVTNGPAPYHRIHSQHKLARR